MPAAPRSFLYAPGDRPDRFARAVDSGADAVILDLEDGVGPAAKDVARRAVAEALAAAPGPVPLWVRVNAGEAMAADLAAVVGSPGLAGVLVPKATVAAVRTALRAGAPRVCALVETAAGVLELPALAAEPGVSHLAIGEADLAADLGVTPGPGGAELAPIRLQAVVASAAAGIAAPTGPVSTDFRDLDALRASTEGLARLGFGARACIHPAQVPVINAAFTPSPAEIERARDLVDRFDAAGGGVGVAADGRMIDEAVVRAARRLLSRAP